MKKAAAAATAVRRAVGYVRVSTEEQAQGDSLDSQEARIRAYCAFHDIEIVRVFRDEGVSGTVPLAKRPYGPQLLAALEESELGIQNVIGFKLDRLFRDAIDCLTVVKRWDKHDVTLHLVDMGGQALDTSSAMGRFFLTIMAGLAEWERNLIAERTRTVMQHKKAQGQRFGRNLLGFKRPMPKGHEDVDIESFRAAMRIFELGQLRKLGMKRHRPGKPQPVRIGYGGIAAQLQEEGFKPRYGETWWPMAIKRVLQEDEFYRKFIETHGDPTQTGTSSVIIEQTGEME